MGAITVLAIGARLLIKDPEPPRTPPRTAPIRIAPGVLQNLPQHVQDKLDPQVLAALRRADQDALEARETAVARSDYRPAETPLRNIEDEEAYRKEVFVSAKRRQLMERQKENVILARDLSKPMLVRFRRGGTIRAEQARMIKDKVEIFYDKTLLAGVPRRSVLSVTEEGLTWKEPVPIGFVKIKPAKGITVTVKQGTAKRITIKKSVYDET